MTLQSRLLGVFAQYPDPRVGVLTTEVVAAPLIYHLPYQDSPYLVIRTKYTLPGLVQARCDIAELQANASGPAGFAKSLTDEERAVFWQLPPLLGDEDARIVGTFWVEMLRSGRHYTGDVSLITPTKYDAIVPWLARLAAVELRLVRKGTQDANTLYKTLQSWPRALSNIADWGHATHPDLMRLTFNQALYRSRRWHAALARQQAAEGAIPGEVVYRFGDGWTMQKLTTREHLKGEAGAMGHCIYKVPDYYRRMQSLTGEAYSLRDNKGLPVVTLFVGVRTEWYCATGDPCTGCGPATAIR